MTPIRKQPSSGEDDGLLLPNMAESEEFDLQETQEKLLALKRQMEEYETKAQELEALKQKRAEADAGLKSMKAKLTRALTVLERAEYNARKEIEQIQSTLQIFGEQLDRLENVDPAEWTPEEIDQAYTKAVSEIDNAHVIFEDARMKVDVLNNQDSSENAYLFEEAEGRSVSPSFTSDSFMGMMWKGLAFTLPLILILILITLMLMTKN